LYLLSADVGVGLGLIINHDLFEGDRNAAGEVGFVLPIQRKNGQYYTLEDRVSIHALSKRYGKLKGKPVSFESFSRDVKAGKAKALQLYEAIINDLAVAMTNIASILDIKTVIVDGRVFDLKEDMIQELNETIRVMTPFETRVTKTTLLNKSILGAITVGVDRIIEGMIE
jgi:predicted NBD/HSP70 family sugar kinase